MSVVGPATLAVVVVVHAAAAVVVVFDGRAGSGAGPRGERGERRFDEDDDKQKMERIKQVKDRFQGSTYVQGMQVCEAVQRTNWTKSYLVRTKAKLNVYSMVFTFSLVVGKKKLALNFGLRVLAFLIFLLRVNRPWKEQ